MIAGMNRQFDIDVFVNKEELIKLKSGKLDGPLIWPSYLFCEYLFLRLDNHAVDGGRILGYKNKMYYVNISNDFCIRLEKSGRAHAIYSPNDNKIAMHDVNRMNDYEKMYRHLINKCIIDINHGIKLRYDGLDSRKSLNTFFDNDLLPEFIFNELEDKLRNGPARI